MGMTHPAVNFVAAQTEWLALVLSAAVQRSWFGIGSPPTGGLVEGHGMKMHQRN